MISNLYPSDAHPSFGTFVRARVDALAACGASVTVVANTDPAVHRRLARKYASLAGRAVLTGLRLARARARPDVVEAHIAFPTGLVALPVAWLLHRPLVLFAHGADVTVVLDRSRASRIVGSWLLRRASLIVANSDFLAGVITAALPDVAPRTVVVSPGLEVERFSRRGPDEPPSGAREGILFVGRLVPQKGVHILVEALAGMPAGAPVRLTIIGVGPEMEVLQSFARRHGVAATFAGEQDRDEVARAMRSAAMVIVPSTYEEPLGLVALEAMAAGALVVVTATGGLGSLVDDGITGIVVAPGDPAALRDGVERALAILAAPARRADVGAAALASVQRHDVRQSARATLEIFGGLSR